MSMKARRHSQSFSKRLCNLISKGIIPGLRKCAYYCRKWAYSWWKWAHEIMWI